MVCQPQGRAVGSAAQAGPLLRGGTWWQGWQAHIILADMGVGAGIADLMFDPARQRAHRRGCRLQKQVVGIIIRHGNV